MRTSELNAKGADATMVPMMPCRLCFLLTLLSAPVLAAPAATQPGDYFAIEVVDSQTGRGVPMVELQTTNSVRYYTDSAGLVAFHEPGLMNRRVFFGVSSLGYEFPPDGFGMRGVALETKPGGSTTLKIERINIAERLYRITGQGIYRDSVLLGRKPPIAEPLLNAEVTGQDGVLNAIYRGKLYWFYGDTVRLAYALGNFSMTGATTALPEKINPDVGFSLNYFTAKDGFTRPMARVEGEGVVWLFGVVVVPDESGKDRMFAYFQRRRGLGAVLENGFVAYNDQRETFEKLKVVPVDPPYFPYLYHCRVTSQGVEYLVFSSPYPNLRVRADAKSYLDLDSYEGYTCLKPGTVYSGKDQVQLDRDAAGKLVWAWKRATPP